MIGVSFYGDFLATAGWAWALVNKAGKLLVGALGTVPGCLAQSAAVAEHYAVYHLRSVATGGLRVVTDCKGVVSNWARGDSYARRPDAQTASLWLRGASLADVRWTKAHRDAEALATADGDERRDILVNAAVDEWAKTAVSWITQALGRLGSRRCTGLCATLKRWCGMRLESYVPSGSKTWPTALPFALCLTPRHASLVRLLDRRSRMSGSLSRRRSSAAAGASCPEAIVRAKAAPSLVRMAEDGLALGHVLWVAFRADSGAGLVMCERCAHFAERKAVYLQRQRAYQRFFLRGVHPLNHEIGLLDARPWRGVEEQRAAEEVALSRSRREALWTRSPSAGPLPLPRGPAREPLRGEAPCLAVMRAAWNDLGGVRCRQVAGGRAAPQGAHPPLR